jgi:Na+/proline symporter
MLWYLFSWLITIGFVMTYPIGIQQVVSLRQGKSKVLNSYPKVIIAAWVWPVYCFVFIYRSIRLAVEDANDMIDGLSLVKKSEEKRSTPHYESIVDVLKMFWK